MSREPDLGRIYDVLSTALGTAEDQLYSGRLGIDGYDRWRIRRDLAQMALAEYSKLSELWPKAKAVLEESERAYDRYVSREPEPDACCSCHINPPCGFCTSQNDIEHADGAA